MIRYEVLWTNIPLLFKYMTAVLLSSMCFYLCSLYYLTFAIIMQIFVLLLFEKLNDVNT